MTFSFLQGVFSLFTFLSNPQQKQKSSDFNFYYMTVWKEEEGIQSETGCHGRKIGIVKASWNAAIVDELAERCKSRLEKRGCSVETVTVPGSYELPLAAKARYILPCIVSTIPVFSVASFEIQSSTGGYHMHWRSGQGRDISL